MDKTVDDLEIWREGARELMPMVVALAPIFDSFFRFSLSSLFIFDGFRPVEFPVFFDLQIHKDIVPSPLMAQIFGDAAACGMYMIAYILQQLSRFSGDVLCFTKLTRNKILWDFICRH